jgi:hypothetical protein
VTQGERLPNYEGEIVRVLVNLEAGPENERIEYAGHAQGLGGRSWIKKVKEESNLHYANNRQRDRATH